MLERGHLEKKLLVDHKVIAGVDEVGKGPVAGDVFAACVILNYDQLLDLDSRTLSLIRDSKTLSTRQRRALLPVIKSCSVCAIGISTVEEIETVGIDKSTFMAMNRALSKCNVTPDILLVDGSRIIPECNIKQMPVIKGDMSCYCIAAASIVAKEVRDDYMKAMATRYPKYGFDTHMGYCTKRHRDAITAYGPCTIHRMNFSPLNKI